MDSRSFVDPGKMAEQRIITDARMEGFEAGFEAGKSKGMHDGFSTGLMAGLFLFILVYTIGQVVK